MPTLPKKLKHDAIVEAVFEIRFDPGQELPEIVVGKLADSAKWDGYTAMRLPSADIPQALRASDPNLFFLPSIQLSAINSPINVKIGSNAIICSMPKPYRGWADFHRLQSKAIKDLFGAVPSVEVKRLGLRYVNVLEAKLHNINSISELRLAVSVGDNQLVDDYNLNFRVSETELIHCQIRLATRNFTLPLLSGDAHTLIDIDVYTPDGFSTRSASGIEAWLDQAHESKNRAFFRMFTDKQIEELREE